MSNTSPLDDDGSVAKRYRTLVEAVVDYAIYMMDADGRIATWNPGAERIKQYRPNEIIGQHYSVFFTDEDRQTGRPQELLQAAARVGRAEHEGWRVRKDGSRFWAHAVLDAIYEDGTLIGYAKITRDITERHRAQLALEQTREQLFQSQKLEAIGQLTGGVAHDFNNLLAAILSAISLIERNLGNPSRVGNLLATMRQAVDRGQKLTQQLLTFARRQPLQPEVVDARERLTDTLNLIDRLIGSNIRVVTEFPSDVWPIRVDPSQFELAIINVCLNARDAMPSGGTLTVSTRNEPMSEHPTLGTGEYVAISISDTGTGIKPEIRNKIFEPFFTTKDVGKGSGLGLSQAYGFARQSGGDIAVDTEVGKGTTVTFRFPAARDSAALAKVGQQRGTVLVVEDDMSLAELTTALLEHAGFSVKLAHDARAALNLLRTDQVDAVFSDVMMPGGMNGFDLATAIHRDFPQLPVMLTTGYSDAVEDARKRGVDVIAKPYDPEKVARQLSQLIERSRGPAALH